MDGKLTIGLRISGELSAAQKRLLRRDKKRLIVFSAERNASGTADWHVNLPVKSAIRINAQNLAT
jgi:hypothetical protein